MSVVRELKLPDLASRVVALDRRLAALEARVAVLERGGRVVVHLPPRDLDDRNDNDVANAAEGGQR